MGKLKIDDLHYIVMEGGGARGNTYVGAIKALETEFKKKLLSDTNISTPKLSPEKLQEIRNSKDINRFPVMSIMDFEEEDSEGKKIPIIRGLAGGSAGSITSFALSLGLSSDEILNEVLKYDFTSFLSETHAGKYRMIDENSNLVIGEDSNEEVGGETKEKIGEVTTTNKLALFKYQLNKNKTNIHGSNSKFVKRNIIINFSLKVIVDGLLINIDQFSKFIRTILGNDYSNPSVLGKEWNKLMSVIRNDSNKASNYLIHTLINRIINMLIFAALRIFTPLKKIGANPTAGLLFDRGFFSGFQVREFFYDMMIFAATRDTLFQRKLIEY
ncbi:MAG: hypothetical protein H8E98_01070, partial [Bacteroidetes bacterium]|nr:hypothetical protein [Bacteroidota bacterium]